MSYTLYDVLEIPSSSTFEEIKTAYKKLAKQYHPDKNAGNSWHEEQFKKINQAYQILSNPVKRRIYDSRIEYETFRKENPIPRAKHHYQRNAPQYKRPEPVQKSPPLIDISNRKINFLVLGYYLITILVLQLIYIYQDIQKIKDVITQGIEYEKSGQYNEAIFMYSKAIAMDEEYSEAYERRGIARLHTFMGIEDALDDFSMAISYADEPTDSLLFKRARCYYQLNNYPLAMIDFEKIISHQDQNIDSVFFFRAEINFSLQNYHLAVPDYSKFILSHPKSIDAHWKRGICYFVNNDFENALPDYNYIITEQPDNAEHYYYRGIINFALKDTSGGCVDLNDSFLLGYTGAEEPIKMYCK
jgi:curved DNA-binding protein CbpA